MATQTPFSNHLAYEDLRGIRQFLPRPPGRKWSLHLPLRILLGLHATMVVFLPPDCQAPTPTSSKAEGSM